MPCSLSLGQKTLLTMSPSGALASGTGGCVCLLNTIGFGGSTTPYTSQRAFRNTCPLGLISDQAYQNLQGMALMISVCGQDRGFLLCAPVTL